MEIPQIPSLVDPVIIHNIKKHITKDIDISKPKQLGGLFGFFSEKYNDNLLLIFCVVFFLILAFYLYYRHKEKRNENKEKPINEFISSVENYLYPQQYYSF